MGAGGGGAPSSYGWLAGGGGRSLPRGAMQPLEHDSSSPVTDIVGTVNHVDYRIAGPALASSPEVLAKAWKTFVAVLQKRVGSDGVVDIAESRGKWVTTVAEDGRETTRGHLGVMVRVSVACVGREFHPDAQRRWLQGLRISTAHEVAATLRADAMLDAGMFLPGGAGKDDRITFEPRVASVGVMLVDSAGDTVFTRRLGATLASSMKNPIVAVSREAISAEGTLGANQSHAPNPAAAAEARGGRSGALREPTAGGAAPRGRSRP